MMRPKRIRIGDLNAQLTCHLCKGYFIDATTVIECLHTFCRSCIVQYLEKNKYCPVCDVQIHKSKPLLNIRPDKTIQEIVYKLVPRLYQNEIARRKVFYEEHPESKPSFGDLYSDGSYQHLLAPEETVSLTLNYFGCNGMTRYLRCPAAVSVGHLKKLIQAKYDLNDTHKIDILYNQDCLTASLTLMDISYMYSWKKKTPLELTYKIYECSVVNQSQPDAKQSNNNNWKEVQLRISENGEMSITATGAEPERPKTPPPSVVEEEKVKKAASPPPTDKKDDKPVEEVPAKKETPPSSPKTQLTEETLTSPPTPPTTVVLTTTVTTNVATVTSNVTTITTTVTMATTTNVTTTSSPSTTTTTTTASTTISSPKKAEVKQSPKATKRKLEEPKNKETPPIKKEKEPKLDKDKETKTPPTILNHSIGLMNLSSNHPLRKHAAKTTRNGEITTEKDVVFSKPAAPPPKSSVVINSSVCPPKRPGTPIALPPGKLMTPPPPCYMPKTTIKAATSAAKPPLPVAPSLSTTKSKSSYTTLWDPPKSWNSQISKAVLKSPGGGATSEAEPNKTPAKFFKVRNNMPRYLGNPASGVKPMYQVQTEGGAGGGGAAPEIKKHSIVKIDPKTLKPISEKAPETTSLSNNDLKINTSSVSIFNKMKTPKGGAGNDRKSPKSPHSPKASPTNKRDKINLNFTPPNPFIPNLTAPTMSPNQFFFPGAPGFASYDPRMMAAYNYNFWYGQRMGFPAAAAMAAGLSLDLNHRAVAGKFELPAIQPPLSPSSAAVMNATKMSAGQSNNMASPPPPPPTKKKIKDYSRHEKSLENAVEKLTKKIEPEVKEPQETAAVKQLVIEDPTHGDTKASPVTSDNDKEKQKSSTPTPGT